MRRRAFIAALGSAAAWPVVARAQQPSRSTIGLIGGASPEDNDPRMRRRVAVLAGAVVWLLIAGASGKSVQAEEWPGRLVTMVVPYAAGGPVDTVGRIMAAGMSEKLR